MSQAETETAGLMRHLGGSGEIGELQRRKCSIGSHDHLDDGLMEKAVKGLTALSVKRCDVSAIVVAGAE